MDETYSIKVSEQLTGGITGSNIDCPYYPCHEKGQDCTFCFCPFYPCMDADLGKIVIGKRGMPVWSCKECMLPHRTDVAKLIYSSLKDEWPPDECVLKRLFHDSKAMFMIEK